MTNNNTSVNQEDLKTVVADYLEKSDPEERDKDIDILTETVNSLNKDLDELQAILEEEK